MRLLAFLILFALLLALICVPEYTPAQGPLESSTKLAILHF
jgi:hypothetical protein